MPAEKVTIKSENRRSNKPLMEKRRRARINQSLTELKNLILDAMKKDTSRSSKLEKADILEMAVRHLQNLQLQKSISVSVTNPSSSSPPPPPSPEDELDVNRNQKHSKYRAGYNECAKEVSHFLDTVDGIDSAVRGRLVAHLLNCLNVISESTAIDKGNKPVVPPVIINAKVDDDDSGCYSISMDSEPSSAENTSSSLSPVSSSSVFDNGTLPLPVTSASSVPQPIHIHIPATSIPLSILSNRHPLKHSSVISSPATFHGLQLVPTRLSTGEFAFVVPNSHPCSSVSTASANMFSSSSSVPSGSRQPQSSPEPTAEAFPRDVRHSSSCGHSKHNKPFPLVISDEPVWRPW